MCGIIGYVGTEPVEEILLTGLKRLEYRGYDSSGIAVLDSNSFIVQRKSVGMVEKLEDLLKRDPIQSIPIGIGHTRWATHGKVSEYNSHPHVSGKVAVVHNGVIDNHEELKHELMSKGRVFLSETDTEVVPQLINDYIETENLNPITALRKAVKRLKGKFSLVIMLGEYKDILFAVCRGNPLVIGQNESGAFIASDEHALYGFVDKVCHLMEGETALVSHTSKIGLYNSMGKEVQLNWENLDTSNPPPVKGEYSHFMLKEMYEQPKVVQDVIISFMNHDKLAIILPRISWNFKQETRISLIGCGTAYHAALLGREWFERIAGVRAVAETASEFQYREPVLGGSDLGIFISQSGETADTISALKLMKEKDCTTLALVNKAGSALSRLADFNVPTLAGPEMAVASTKAFLAQVTTLACFSIGVGVFRKKVSTDRESQFISALSKLGLQLQEILNKSKEFIAIAKEIASSQSIFYIGRGTSYPVALEGALKMKEIAYIHAEGYAAGELKHGPLALIYKDVPTIVLAPPDFYLERTMSNMENVITRHGPIILLSDEATCGKFSSKVLRSVVLPETDPILYPIIMTVILQLIAYHTAKFLGQSIDFPRNLAKSVTVE